ncbi:chemotaxis protein CheW [Nocardioides sp. InS609-2]|uniref:chemotaxis protein CheW n=1 Tax=Nocardioides sp. InS609-2 TaxID=2760705 RepID=UPI0017AD8833|nr:chemotaxis protein CheW [Nocardioides sp. InS609-2]MBA3783570.1 chemotaxis protein CheW [Nocardioides sp.]
MSTRFVTFTLDARLYGVRVESVREVLRGLPRTRIPLAPSTLAGLINLRGQVLSAIDLREQLGMPPHTGEADQMMVVIRAAGESVALLVDSIGAVVDVEDDQFESPPDTLSATSRELLLGAYKLDHRLLLALDVDRAVAA